MGDDTSWFQQYGGMIMMHTPGNNAVEGRFSNVEFRWMGQAFGLGRYPIHFHMVGSVSKSYVKNCTVSDTFNRAVTIHGIHDLLVEHNIAYNIRGHAFFIEDGNERNNTIQYNLGINIRPVAAL